MSDQIQIGDVGYVALCERRGLLIDIKYIRGLSDEETAELAAIDARLDEAEEPFYAAVMENISAYLGLDTPPPATGLGTGGGGAE